MNAYFAARGWVLAALLAGLLYARGLSDAPLQPQWLFLVAAGMALRLWAGAHLGAHGNAARAQAPALADGGPYRYSRNPLYLSNIAMAAGLILFADALPHEANAALIAAVFAHHALLVRHEERALAAQPGAAGAAYAAYRAAVPRWFSLRPPASDPAQGEESAQAVPHEEDAHDVNSAWRRAWTRQARNVGYAALAVAIVWAAARWA